MPAAFQNQMEERYGEHYAQKVEDRLLHYLHKLETMLPGDTYIDKVCFTHVCFNLCLQYGVPFERDVQNINLVMMILVIIIICDTTKELNASGSSHKKTTNKYKKRIRQ